MKKNIVLLLALLFFVGGLQAIKPINIDYRQKMKDVEEVLSGVEMVRDISEDIKGSVSNFDNPMNLLEEKFPPPRKSTKQRLEALARFLTSKIREIKSAESFLIFIFHEGAAEVVKEVKLEFVEGKWRKKKKFKLKKFFLDPNRGIYAHYEGEGDGVSKDILVQGYGGFLGNIRRAFEKKILGCLQR